MYGALHVLALVLRLWLYLFIVAQRDGQRQDVKSKSLMSFSDSPDFEEGEKARK